MKKSDIILYVILATLYTAFVWLTFSPEYSPYARCIGIGGLPPQCLYYDFFENGLKTGLIQRGEEPAAEEVPHATI